MQPADLERIVLRVLILIVIAFGLSTIVWAGIQLTGSVQGAAVTLSSVFVPSEEKFEAVLDMPTVKDSETFNVHWVHLNAKQPGEYRVIVSCRPGVSIQAAGIHGEFIGESCDTPFNESSSDDSQMLRLTSSRNRFIDVPIRIDFYPATGIGVISPSPSLSTRTLAVVENDRVATSPSLASEASNTQLQASTTDQPNDHGSFSRPEQSSQSVDSSIHSSQDIYTPATPTTGKPNLIIRMLDVGYINTATGAFIRSDSIPPSAKAAVLFAVENNGTVPSGEWKFNALLPTSPPHVYTSKPEQSLNPGDRTELTLGFDTLAANQNEQVLISIDSNHSITESNEDDNTLSIPIHTSAQ